MARRPHRTKSLARGPKGAAHPTATGARIAGDAPTDAGAYALDDATITLDLPSIDAASEELSLRVPVGPVPIDALVPTARALSTRVTLRVLEHERAQQRSVSCGPACGACCRQLVPISAVEARMLARVLAAMNAEQQARVRARFDAAIARLRAEGLLAPSDPRGAIALRGRGADAKSLWLDVSKRYFNLQIPCPFLEDESCSIHETAPLVCREFHVTSDPSHCRSLDGGAVSTPRPLRMSEVLAAAGHRAAPGEAPRAQMPLVLALDWAQVHGGDLDGAFDGEALFHALVGAIAEADAG